MNTSLMKVNLNFNITQLNTPHYQTTYINLVNGSELIYIYVCKTQAKLNFGKLR